MPRLGVDVGGTFIDLVLVDGQGGVAFEKVLADPADIVDAIRSGVDSLLRRAGVEGAAVTEVVHATTRGSNTVLERTGPRVALVATAGFRDLLQIQRALRWSMYDVQLDKPEPLVPRSLSFDVPERTLADGSVETPLDEDALRAVAATLRENGVEGVAVAFLHSYVRPEHERRACEILGEEIPGAVVTASSDVSLQAREYERANTAVVDVYVTPAVDGYLEELAVALPDVGIAAPLRIMQSSGGLATIESARARPVRTLESGPAAGVLAAARFGAVAGYENVISFDMGGTTAKAAVVRAGVPATASYFEIERVENRRGSGLPVDIPAIDLVEIGTGGGSIADVRYGALRVGPRSAGAEPGPACYGRGGDRPTVTDANLLLGLYDPRAFAGGAIELDVAAAAAAVDRLAVELGIDRQRAAWGIHELATLDMEHAIRLVSINRGFDPREHALVCIGGGGPVHGPRLARALGCRVALVPPVASGGSALGLVEASESTEVALTAVVRLDADGAAARCRAIARDLEAAARDGLLGHASDVVATWSIGLRYVGQGYELRVTAPADPGDVAAVEESFHRAYERAYGYRADGQAVEAVTWHLALVRHRADLTAEVEALSDRPERHPAASSRRRVFDPSRGETEVDVHERDALVPGDVLDGPCLVAEATTTTVVLAGDVVRVAANGTLVIAVGEGGGVP